MTDKIEHATRAVSGVSAVLREVTRERDELRAEVERLQGERIVARDLWDDATKERDKARAEVERLSKLVTTFERFGDMDTDNLNDLADENERLRAVVEVAREIQRGSETWYVPGDILDRLNSTLAALAE